MKPLAKTITLALLTGLISVNSYSQEKSNPHPDPVLPKQWSMPTEQPDHVILTFAGSPATTQSVTWRTDTTIKQAVAEIAIATAAPRFWRNAKPVTANTERMDAAKVKSAEVVAHYHSVTFTGLTPDTLYAYRVGDGQHWSEWFHFRTASGQPKPFSFLYVGDAQNYILELWSRLIREGYRKVPDARFIIHAGDLVSDAHSERQWHEWFTAGGWIHGMLPSVPVPGNHEYEGYSQAEEDNDISHLSVQWRPQFTLPENGPKGQEETAYVMDYQGMRVIALNSSKMRPEQARWVDSVLTNNPNKWTVVTFHHPIFSSAKERDNKELRALWKPIFDKHGVDLALQGHDHSYARGRTAASTKNLMKGVNARDTETGTVYVVSVSGGKMYTLKKDLWDNYEAKLDRKAENTQLFQVIHVDGDTLRYEAYTATGELYDAFDLIKQGKNKPNRFVERIKPAGSEYRHDNTTPYEVSGGG